MHGFSQITLCKAIKIVKHHNSHSKYWLTPCIKNPKFIIVTFIATLTENRGQQTKASRFQSSIQQSQIKLANLKFWYRYIYTIDNMSHNSTA